jgi:hypothetical protein
VILKLVRERFSKRAVKRNRSRRGNDASCPGVSHPVPPDKIFVSCSLFGCEHICSKMDGSLRGAMRAQAVLLRYPQQAIGDAVGDSNREVWKVDC